MKLEIMVRALRTVSIRFGIALLGLSALLPAKAQPTIVSTTPADGSRDVAASTPLIITFSDAMNTDPTTTFAMFLDGTTYQPLSTVIVGTWNAAGTILTNNPVPSFPSGKTIAWIATGEDLDGFPLMDPAFPPHSFTTSGGGGSTGSGTNRVTSFTLGKPWYYDQLGAGTPTLDTNNPYTFMATTVLASNRTASAVTLMMPNSAVSNLVSYPFSPENYSLVYYTTNPSAVDTAFPSGNYTFTVMSTTNQLVTANFPTTATMPQPGAPHVTNYAACQAINPAQAFTIGWDAFSGGTTADYISLSIGSNFRTPDPLSPGALDGTARSVQIPAGTLQPNTSDIAVLGFYKMIINTNNSTYWTTVYRATVTEFNISTTGSGGSTALVLTNGFLTSTNFKFNVTSGAGQTFTVEYSTTMLPGSWQTLSSTNPPGTVSQFADPGAATNRFIFYRARTGL